MNNAYRMSDRNCAFKLLNNIARRLEHDCPGAAASLREGLADTLTVLRFGLPEALQRTLVTTNSHREPERPRPSSHEERQAVGERSDGAPMACLRYPRGRLGFPTSEGICRNAEARGSPSRSRCASRSSSCQNARRSRVITSIAATQFQQYAGHHRGAGTLPQGRRLPAVWRTRSNSECTASFRNHFDAR